MNSSIIDSPFLEIPLDVYRRQFKEGQQGESPSVSIRVLRFRPTQLCETRGLIADLTIRTFKVESRNSVSCPSAIVLELASPEHVVEILRAMPILGKRRISRQQADLLISQSTLATTTTTPSACPSKTTPATPLPPPPPPPHPLLATKKRKIISNAMPKLGEKKPTVRFTKSGSRDIRDLFAPRATPKIDP